MNNEFYTLGLSNEVLKSIDMQGFEKPSKIQKEIIPFILEGNDVIGEAQTGTGKTLAFAASVLSKINVNDNKLKTLVLVPTRELALQVSEEFETLNKSSKFDILSVFGGSSIDLQIRALKRGVDIVVGTPGRVKDLIDRKVMELKNLEYFILDEADEMLNMGFLEDIEYIFNKTKPERQVLLFSATMPKPILTLAQKYMKDDYKHVSIIEKTKTSINVKQCYYLINQKIRTEAMFRVIDSKNINKAIIFCQTKREVDELVGEMQKRGYNVEAMHGDIVQKMRIQTLSRFKEGAFNYLIATDVAARGIHVDDIEYVINYNLPQEIESYIHRIGRTGRANKEGEAITFVNPKEVRILSEIERHTKGKIEKKEIPNVSDIFLSKYENILTKVNQIIDNKENEECIKYVRDLNKTDLIKLASGLMKLVFEKEIGSNINKEFDFTVESKKKHSDESSTRVFLTIGKMDKLKKGTLLDFLKDITKLNKDNFKNIEILTKFTFMDIKNDVVDEAISKIYNKKLNNRVIRIEKAKKR